MTALRKPIMAVVGMTVGLVCLWLALRSVSLVKVGLVLIVLWTAAVPAFAQTDSDTNGTGISHGFAVSDGDTVKFGRQRVRLFGIDAPEKGQPCDGGHWYPGSLATKALIAFIAGRPVSCHQVDYDQKNSHPVAVCFAGKDDLQALMVSAGWAWAHTQYGDRYVPEEKDAMARKVGVHAHRCQPPWEWRAQQRAEKKAGQ
jgi:endonuclease YncB( thermonuclease family)